ncbi:hypothetical protein [Guyparkeria halopsychrophila]|uniref:hypothetical protein n=1 Tax=Guyparkeria halopsychrophila TaxID=3139421 RepID=UPI0037C6E4C5
MPKTAIVRIGTTTRSGHAGQRLHDTRGQIPDYVDPKLCHLNTTPIPVPRSPDLAKKCEHRRLVRYKRGELRRRPGPIRSDGIVAVRGIVAFSSDAQSEIQSLPVTEQDRRYVQTAEAIAERLTTTVAGLVVHRDESAPHAHFTLHGVGLDGQPVSRRMNRQALREIQDIAIEPYADLGFERGRSKRARIADGESPSAWVHRSVSELHRDLPAELESARNERDRAIARAEEAEAMADAEVAQALQRVEQAEAQAETEIEHHRQQTTMARRRLDQALATADEAEQQVNELRQRLREYESRAKEAEQRLAKLQSEHIELEPPRRIERVTGREKRHLLGECIETKQALVYPARKVQAAFKEAEKLRQAAEARALAAEEKVREEKRTRSKLLAGWSTVMPTSQEPSHADLASGSFRQLHGLISVEGEQTIGAPPQEATPHQIATALYLAGCDADWERLAFNVSDDVAAEIIRKATEDGRLDHIEFHTPGRRHRQMRMVSHKMEQHGGARTMKRPEDEVSDMTPEDHAPIYPHKDRGLNM